MHYLEVHSVNKPMVVIFKMILLALYLYDY